MKITANRQIWNHYLSKKEITDGTLYGDKQMKTIQLHWKDYRWNEAIVTFDVCLKQVSDSYKREHLSLTVPIISDRLANSTWPSRRNLQS